MSKKDVYKTVKKQSQSLLIEKKSKFIANVKPVDNEDDALAFLNEMRSKYSDATHNVYAYVIDEIIFFVTVMTANRRGRQECPFLTQSVNPG